MHAPLIAGVRAGRFAARRRRDPGLLISVLLHALAHAARGDFGWNLAQRLHLALVWIQPAAWRLHRDLRCEREMCCDARAVARGAAPATLARALVRLAEGQGTARLAMGLGGEADLAARLRRLLGAQPDAAARSPAPAVGLGLVLLMTLGAGRLATADPSIRDAYVASAFGPTLVLEARDPAGVFSLRVRHGQVIAASVGGDVLPPGRIVQRGGDVTLVSAAHAPLLALSVSPAGTIRWSPRR